MKTKTIEFETLSLTFTTEEDNWQLNLAKSQTKVQDFRQTRILTEAPEDVFVPVKIVEEDDSFTFTFTVDQNKKKWEDLSHLHRNEKLRLLCNVIQLKKHLNTRVSFFIHPDNLVFDGNLKPFIIYRGVRDLLPPFEMSEQGFLKQMQCLSIALFSKKYNFDQLYNGALKDAQETEFERQVSEMTEIDSLLDYLQERYQDEQRKVDQEMQVVPIKRFRLFKRLSIGMIVVAVLLAIPLVYYGLFNQPYQQRLLDSHEEYLASNYGEVISTLQNKPAEKLPKTNKYILARSYIHTGDLPDSDKKSVMNNVSMKSDTNYLLYWIYNGQGAFDDALDKAKYLDDPQLIMYGLIQQIEKAKNNPDLSGQNRDETVKALQDELSDYREEYGLEENQDEVGQPTNAEERDTEQQYEEDIDKDQIESEDHSEDER